MEGFDTPNTRGAGAETDARYPTHPEEPPDSYGRTQLIGLALFIGVPILIIFLVRVF